MNAIDMQADIEMFADSVRTWISDHAALSAQRTRGGNADRQRWHAMAALGWGGLTIGAEYGGAGLGLPGLCAAMTALGRELLGAPLLSTAVSKSLFENAASAEQRAIWLPRLRDGAVVALAIDESARHEPQRIATMASTDRQGWRLDGRKTMVIDAGLADAVVVVAGMTGEASRIGLFLVPADAPTRNPRHTIDERDYADLHFDGLRVAASALLGGAPVDREVLDDALDVARIGLAAEMLGVGARALDLIVDHLCTRRQFGRAIGEFQALQHRAAIIKVDLELAGSALAAAVVADRRERPAHASLAKAMAGEALHRASVEIVQMHGGMGMSDEHVAGLFLKRARVAEALYGNRSFHAGRWAGLHGY
ncbi:acyl-CoA dehydrogenase family protein [Solimonas terrae]|uniref:Acyl-CoA dehydrogenase family protein n=1 Tax=Solimonas terrae TaxID=1396819 RepID=A0A6M2BPV4_9GAMM|nr:acyl-CoA dehydrogenase family protein [Solimonas terrae]NGY04320.1 acyl-CoA dehydrogenase family protein [Solimonas terrae]